MIVWRCVWSNEDGRAVSWHSTKTGAQAQMVQENIEVFYLHKVELPERKSDLIAWLNRHFSTDNG